MHRTQEPADLMTQTQQKAGMRQLHIWHAAAIAVNVTAIAAQKKRICNKIRQKRGYMPVLLAYFELWIKRNVLIFLCFGGRTGRHGNSVHFYTAVNGNDQTLAAIDFSGFD